MRRKVCIFATMIENRQTTLGDLPCSYTVTIKKEQLSGMPRVEFPGRIYVISSTEEAKKAVKALKCYKVLGFDTESKPTFRRGVPMKVALVQISAPDICFLFRLCKMNDVSPLSEIIENPDILKIGLSLHDDFANLGHNYKFNPQGFVDLQKIVPEYHFTCLGLQRIYASLFNERISKSQQLSNWEADTLSDAQQTYAAIDAWACVKIYNRLMSPEFNVEDLTKYIVINQEDDEVEK